MTTTFCIPRIFFRLNSDDITHALALAFGLGDLNMDWLSEITLVNHKDANNLSFKRGFLTINYFPNTVIGNKFRENCTQGKDSKVVYDGHHFFWLIHLPEQSSTPSPYFSETRVTQRPSFMATLKQQNYIRGLCCQKRQPIPNLVTLTKADASKHIFRLRLVRKEF